jgi:hypothetical protein
MPRRKALLLAPNSTITPSIGGGLMQIEAVKQSIQILPITPRLANLTDIASVLYPLLEDD